MLEGHRDTNARWELEGRQGGGDCGFYERRWKRKLVGGRKPSGDIRETL